MKTRRLARRLSPFLTIYLLVVSLGLPLHKVYCACRGITDFSLFEQDHQCGHDEVILANEVAKSSCCTKAADKQCSFEKADNHDCGDDETILAKFKADYLSEQEKTFDDPSDWSAMPSYIFSAQLSYTDLVPKALPIRGPSPPPLPYGRSLLVRQQLFLC